MRKIFEILLLITLSVMFLLVPNGADQWVIWPCLIIFYYYFIQALRSPIIIWKDITTYLKIDLLLLLFYYLLFYMPYQTYVLGMSDLRKSNFLENTYADYTNPSIIACTIGLIAFMMAFNRKSRQKRPRVFKTYTRKQYRRLFGILLPLLLVLSGLFYVTGFAQFVSDAYNGSDTGDSTTDGIYFLVFFFFAIISALVVIYYSRYKKLRPGMIGFLIFCAAFSALLLISGDRNTFFLLAIILGGGYYTYLNKIGLVKIAVFVAGALFLYQIIEISRTADKRSVGAIIEAIEKGDTKNGSSTEDLDESSFTNTTIATRFAFLGVPTRHDYFYGKFKIIGLGGIIPYSRALYVSKNDPYTSSSDFLTAAMGSSFSVGSSIIADAYTDFGLIGVIGIMYLLGAIAKYIQTKAQYNPNSIKWHVVYLLTLGTFAEVSRYSFDFIIRNLVWSVMVFGLFEAFSKKRVYGTMTEVQQLEESEQQLVIEEPK